VLQHVRQGLLLDNAVVEELLLHSQIRLRILMTNRKGSTSPQQLQKTHLAF